MHGSGTLASLMSSDVVTSVTWRCPVAGCGYVGTQDVALLAIYDYDHFTACATNCTRHRFIRGVKKDGALQQSY